VTEADRGRHELRELPNRFTVEADEHQVRVFGEQGRIETALLRSVGADVRNCGSGGMLLRLETDWIEVELR
jgi:hypothetical protein